MFLPNDWNAIRAMYREAMPDIMEAGRNEWGLGVYFWGDDIIHFTPIEAWLWHDIRQCEAVLYPQFPVLRYFLDFANPVARIAIECDGANWHDPVKDAERDRALEAIGWTVYRFPGWMCKQDSDPETGEPAQALKRMQRICDDHGISRNSRMREESRDDWEHMGAQVLHLMERHHAVSQAMRGARSRP